MNGPLRVLFLAAEADPFVKTGGLGDVAASLPRALRALAISCESQFPAGRKGIPEGRPLVAEMLPQVDIRLVIPYHGVIQRQDLPLQKIASFPIQYVDGPLLAEVFSVQDGELPVYLIGGLPFTPDAPVYSADAGLDGTKYTFFSLAALELANALDWAPQIVHANDWHTAPALYAASRQRTSHPHSEGPALVLGLHNLPYLGVGAGPGLAAFGLPPARQSTLPKWAQNLPLPLGLLAADRIVPVSPTYAREILTAEFGSGLHEFLQTRAEAVSGILNGLDVRLWDPEADPFLAARYNRNRLGDRRANKAALQSEIGLAPDPNLPLLAMIGRMDHQKGFDLVPEALRLLDGQPWQALVLGTGDPALEAAARRLEADFPDRFRSVLRFDTALSHRIYSGADALLMPSRYEPCGLTQMIAMRYGCVPIARAVGGLRDTIIDYGSSVDESYESTGFLFDEATPEALAKAIQRALWVYPHPENWEGLQRRGMAQDFSWDHPAWQYLELYRELIPG